MFEDTLLESSARPARIYRTGAWAPLGSLAIQAAMLATLLLLPLVFTQQLPNLRYDTHIAWTPPPPPVQVFTVAHQNFSRAASSLFYAAPLVEPGHIPSHTVRTPDEPGAAIADPASLAVGVPGGTGPASDAFSRLFDRPVVAHVAPPAPTPRIKASEGVTAGYLVLHAQPQYPRAAVLARVSGAVVLEAVIGRDGSIQNLHVVSGHPLLINAAMDAVSRWRYRPYLLNGEPVEVETRITVNFKLAGG